METQKSKHTPGPWEFFPEGLELTRDGDRHKSASVKIEMRYIAFLNEGDARLIAAAPELLDAVKIALEYSNRQNHPRDVNEARAFREHQQEIFKAIILKAEGGR